MRKNQKTIAVLTALSTMIATTACSEEEMRKEYETEKSKVYEDFDEKLAQQQDAIVSRVVSELQGTTAPVVTTVTSTTYDAQATSLTTAATTYKTTVTSDTTESLKPITMRTHETRGPVPTYTTTTNTTTTTTVVEEQPNEKIYKINNQTVMHNQSNGYYVTDRYTIQPVKECQGEMGEYLYSLVTKLYGSYEKNLDIVEKIKELNGLTTNFLPTRRGYILLPGKAVYYRANSALAAQTETELPMDEIKRLNGIKDETQSLGNSYMLVKVLADNENTFKTPKGTAHVCGPAIIFADTYVKCGKTYEDGFVDSALIRNPDDANQCYFIQVQPGGSYCEYLVAENIAGISSTGDNIPFICISNATTLYPIEFTDEALIYELGNEYGAICSFEDIGANLNFTDKKIIDLRTGRQYTK